MTQEEKQQILLRDLCSRLPYGVKVWRQGRNYVVSCIGIKQQSVYLKADFESIRGWWTDIKEIKPYLRPMSSMTEEECITLSRLKPYDIDAWKYIKTPVPLYIANIMQFDFFHSHHLDWRGLIPKGLALEAPKDMYTKEDEK